MFITRNGSRREKTESPGSVTSALASQSSDNELKSWHVVVIIEVSRGDLQLLQIAEVSPQRLPFTSI
jgi:hypothetical protein